MNSSRHSLLASAATVIICHAGPAVAQSVPSAPVQSTPSPTSQSDTAEASGQNSAIAEIVVTAERREQNVQKAPLTIQVIGSEELQRSGLTEAQDLSRIVPGVQVGTGGNASQIFIRGVGDFSQTSLASPGVAFNVDGVYVGRPDGVNGNFYDLQRVEVLKGPQGTLYGRNANGGAINLISNQPQLGETGGYVSTEFGNYADKKVAGAINLPLGNSVAIRGAFNIIDRNGYLSDGTNDQVEQSGRIQLKAEPSQDITLKLSTDYSHLGGKGGGYTYLPLRPGASPWEGTNSPAANQYRASLLPLGPLFNQFDEGEAFQNTKLWNVSGQLDWRLGFATLTILPAYRNSDIHSVENPGESYETANKADQKSLEVRLGNSAPGFDWVVGGYGYDEKISGTNHVFFSNLLLNNRLFYRPDTKAYAAFGQTTFTVIDKFRIIAGARYTSEKRTLTGNFNSETTGTPVLVEDFGGDRVFNKFTWKAGAEYDVAPDSLLYLTASTGFKAGGFNQTVAPLATYEPETLLAYELGSRNRFFDNRLQVNLSIFRWRYTNIQDQRIQFDPRGNVNFIFANSGDANLTGATFDVVTKPSRNDTVSFSVEYNNSHYTRFDVNTPQPFYDPVAIGCPIAQIEPTVPVPTVRSSCTGFQVARVPHWSGGASIEHIFSLSDSSNISAATDVKFSSSRWIATDFIPAERDGAYAVWNANLDYTLKSERLVIGLFIRNITEKAFYTGAIQNPFISGLLAANVSDPRTFGVRATLKFGGE